MQTRSSNSLTVQALAFGIEQPVYAYEMAGIPGQFHHSGETNYLSSVAAPEEQLPSPRIGRKFPAIRLIENEHRRALLWRSAIAPTASCAPAGRSDWRGLSKR